MSIEEAGIKQPSLFIGTEWDVEYPSIVDRPDRFRLAREEAWLSYSQSGNWLWFYNLLMFRYREQLARVDCNFTSTKITTTRQGIRVSFIRDSKDGGLEMAFFVLDHMRPDLDTVRKAFKSGEVEWKKLKF